MLKAFDSRGLAMDIKQLRYFIAVHDVGSFSKAALALSTGQPILTRHIRKLEEELGVELFQRTGHGIIPTEPGKMLRSRVDPALDHFDQLFKDLKEMQAEPIGRLVVALPPSLGAVLAVPFIKEIKATFPKISLQIMEGFSDSILEWLSIGRVDLGVVYNPPSISTMTSEFLIAEELFLIGPQSDPCGVGCDDVKLSHLATLPLALPGRSHGVRTQVECACKDLGVSLSISVEIDAVHPIFALIDEGNTYSILSYAAARPFVENGRIRAWRIVEPTMRRNLALTTPRCQMTQVQRAGARILRAKIRDLVGSGKWISRGIGADAAQGLHTDDRE